MDPWSDWIKAACLPSHCNCEAVRADWIAQPSAFWSSIFYFVALAATWIRIRQKSVALRIWIINFGILALSSHFAHGSMTEVAMACDFAAICWLLLTPGLTRAIANRIHPIAVFASIPIGFLLLAWGFFGAGKLLKIGLALLTFMISILDHWIHEPTRIKDPGFIKAIGILIGAFALFLWDESKLNCEPTSWVQGHTLWHLGSAWAIYEYSIWRFGKST